MKDFLRVMAAIFAVISAVGAVTCGIFGIVAILFARSIAPLDPQTIQNIDALAVGMIGFAALFFVALFGLKYLDE